MRKEALHKLLAGVICLLLAFGMAACGDKDKENANSNNASTANTNATPRSTQPSASEDSAIKNKVEANMTKYGVSGVTVEVSNGEVTLKGDIQRAKLQDAMKAANEANPKKVNNQMNIK